MGDDTGMNMQAGRIFVCGHGDAGQLGLGEPGFDGELNDWEMVAEPRPSPLPGNAAVIPNFPTLSPS